MKDIFTDGILELIQLLCQLPTTPIAESEPIWKRITVLFENLKGSVEHQQGVYGTKEGRE